MIGFIERGYSVCNSLGRSHLNLSGPPRDGRPWPKSIASAQVGFHLLFVTFPQGREPRRPARHDVCRDRNSALTWRDRKSRVRKAHTSPSPSAKCQVSGLSLLFQARLGTRTRIVSKNGCLRAVQYVRFPGGPPPEYWTRLWLLSFGDRTGSGVSNQV